MSGLVLDSLEEVIEDVKRGVPIVMVDDADRENEGDLMVAAEKASEEAITFMLNEGKGLICLSLPDARFRLLGIPHQARENSSVFGTNFGVSIDHCSVGHRGVTAQGRLRTIQAAADPAAAASDFVMPGFVFPVGSVEGGVLKRRGQTEGSVDLARLAGLREAGVICEIMDEEGAMVRGEQLQAYCRKHKLRITSVEEISRFRLHNEVSVRRIGQARIGPDWGLSRSEVIARLDGLHPDIPLRLLTYLDDVEEKEHFALVKGEPADNCLVRIHSQCLTGDVFKSRRCDCGQQFDRALEEILKEGQGVLVYLQQEGRGIGLGNKLKAYELQQQGMDTVDANIQLGFAADQRDYRVGAQILLDLNLHRVRLITNNPDKLKSLPEFGIEVAERVALTIPQDEYNREYLETKRARMGHIIPEVAR